MIWFYLMISVAFNSLIQIHGRQVNGSVMILTRCFHFLMALRIGALTVDRSFSSLYFEKILPFRICLIQLPHSLISVTITDSKYLHRQFFKTMECIE